MRFLSYSKTSKREEERQNAFYDCVIHCCAKVQVYFLIEIQNILRSKRWQSAWLGHHSCSHLRDNSQIQEAKVRVAFLWENKHGRTCLYNLSLVLLCKKNKNKKELPPSPAVIHVRLKDCGCPQYSSRHHPRLKCIPVIHPVFMIKSPAACVFVCSPQSVKQSYAVSSQTQVLSLQITVHFLHTGTFLRLLLKYIFRCTSWKEKRQHGKHPEILWFLNKGDDTNCVFPHLPP